MTPGQDEAVDAAVSAHRALAAAQAQWAEDEQRMKADLAVAVQAALDVRAGAENIASALGVSRARVYQLAGRR